MAIYDRICRACGRDFQGGPRSWYCPNCRKERKKERDAKCRKEPPKRKLGSTDICKNCGEEYIVVSGLQMYCKECQPIMHAELDRRQSLAYYHTNKEESNPKRNAARRVPMRKCAVCGQLFEPSSQQKTCSVECRRIWFRDLNRTIYGKRHRWKIKRKKKGGED